MQNETGSQPERPAAVPVGNPNNAPVGEIKGSFAHGVTNPRDNLVQVADHSSFNFALAIAWIVALLAILATLYFWWLSRNTIDVVAEKQTKLQSIEQQIKAPAMVKAEKDSTDFKTSVEILSKAKKDRFSISTFLPGFYTKITNDVKITSLSLASDGSLSIAGTTKSYRTTADLVLALKSWSTLSNIDLSSVSVSVGESEKPEATFSISAKVATTPAAAAVSAAGSTTDSTTGVTAQPSVGGTQ